MQNDVPIDDEAFDVLTFLSGYGWWMILAVALIVLVIYKKFRN